MRKRFDKIKIKRKLNESERNVFEEKERDIISSYENGESVKSISSRHNLSRERVYQYFRANGFSLEARREHIIQNVDMLNRAVAAYINNKEMTQIEAANEFNIPIHTLRKYLESNNIKKKARGKYNIRTIQYLYVDKNLTSTEVAKQLGLELRALRGYIHRKGIIKIERVEYNKQVIEHLYVNENLSCKQIAEQLGLEHKKLYIYICNNKIKKKK
ncbi:helix-turn-helix domain-containing protein [Pseudomonas moraviensis]|uniref:helix-turn-helix domain-containing protein n=1 Tax=Pseudomonas moraviensis TaxID=321662 RepID=UPI0009E3541E|nr:helix-turn-helix domain-containing protein [Pseudomonas moraviensis]